jgi:hypothetical protein
VGPVLNEFVVAMAFVDVDYSSNVGQCPAIQPVSAVNCRYQANAFIETSDIYVFYVFGKLP